MHPLLVSAPADLIGGERRPLPGEALQSTNPTRPAEIIWQGTPVPAHVDDAVAAARAAQPAWARMTEEKRASALRRFRDLCKARAADMARLIADETGKALWDARAEADLLAAKVDITLDASEHGGLRRVRPFEVSLSGSRVGRAWFRPHGVLAVVGPYNFPAHLANGHIIPALVLGNAVVLKPSDKAPGVGQLYAEWLNEALVAEGAPPGVVNLVQGGVDVASRLVAHPDLDGILFTGSWPVGRRIMEANLDQPGRILALEMGGNNPSLVMPDADLRQAAIEIVRSAFVSTGQRCTCTRRLVVHRAVADKLIRGIVEAATRLSVGDPLADPQPFMGPIISAAARDAVLRDQARFSASGAEVVLPSRALESSTGGHFLSPGVVRVERFSIGEEGPGADIEVFGPLLRVSVVDSLDEGIAQANATRYGLAASIFTRDEAAIERFLSEARAGCVNVNTGTAGASSKLPFGGLGLSGNHRPAGAFSLDYCAYPVAGMIESGSAAPIPTGMAFEDDWLS
ncbi:aldehyde dehydrogenase family protein [Polyangium aurulentum]|uniref:aldehyde dehydrogenase family protein n=1 Tax=Polyangium aurulentum TaxID=2567896 RepID=UPI0010ADDD83|nr:aldehyde dehydrogenase family protein [Polyangium aurulentum]UQA63118.1 aldehyde dehydrogenase family protein [Polyangium aurulentum]